MLDLIFIQSCFLFFKYTYTDSIENATFNVNYERQISSSSGLILIYEYEPYLFKNFSLKIHLSSKTVAKEYPIFAVIRRGTQLTTLQIPQRSSSNEYYQEVSRILCTDSNLNSSIKAEFRFMFKENFINVTKRARNMKSQHQYFEQIIVQLFGSSPKPITFNISLSLVNGYRLSIGDIVTFTVSPSQPILYLYAFPPKRYGEAPSVRLVATSNDTLCAIMSIQSVPCPVFDLEETVKFEGVYQSMLTKSAFTISQANYPSQGFFIVFVVKPTDDECIGAIQRSPTSHYHPNNQHLYHRNFWFGFGGPAFATWENPQKDLDRIKSITLQILPTLTRMDYIIAVLIPLAVFVFIFFVTFSVMAWLHYRDKNRQYIDWLIDNTGSSDSFSFLQSPSNVNFPSQSQDDVSPPIPSEHLDKEMLINKDTIDDDISISSTDSNTEDMNTASTKHSSNTRNKNAENKGSETVHKKISRSPNRTSIYDEEQRLIAKEALRQAYDTDNNPDNNLFPDDNITQNVFDPTKINKKYDDVKSQESKNDIIILSNTDNSINGANNTTTPMSRTEKLLATNKYYLERIRENQAKLAVADLCRKHGSVLHEKYLLFHWNLIPIAIFYILPVIQLVFTYEKIINLTGNQDFCYFNLMCAHPLGNMTSFNNIYSNIGYILLGILFFILVWRRDRIRQNVRMLNGSIDKYYGIPQHFGLFYAMAVALCFEGILSSCYHVCPNYSNYQFDTSFMYIITCLTMLKIYQTRHPDKSASSYYSYFAFALIVVISVIGVLHGDTMFWSLFSICHVLTCLYLSLQIYYIGHWKLDHHIFHRARQFWCEEIPINPYPKHPDRLILLILANLANLSICIYGLYIRPKNFPSYILSILILNLLLYLSFYIIMKIRSGEKILIYSSIFIACSMICWALACYFFLHGNISWQVSPAQSRQKNRECIAFKFYDVHDIWHFFSALALFFSFTTLLTLDDDLIRKRRDEIPVF